MLGILIVGILQNWNCIFTAQLRKSVMSLSNPFAMAQKQFDRAVGLLDLGQKDCKQWGPFFRNLEPDIMTNVQYMLWMLDEIEAIHGTKYPGFITGEPIRVGGSLGRKVPAGSTYRKDAPLRSLYACIY
jgi:hypothetical protein